MNLHIDCSSGICSDMIYKALVNLGPEYDLAEQLQKILANAELCKGDPGDHERSYKEVKDILVNAKLPIGAGRIAEKTYRAIAVAEAKVHGATLETVHFHEVGRYEAIGNIIAVALIVDKMKPDKVTCSPIHDGFGTILCSHGKIPVPVPAVAAMKDQCQYDFIQEDIEMELVTPSGLALLIGLNAVKGSPPLQSEIKRMGIGRGTRKTGKTGLKVYEVIGSKIE